MTSASTEPSLSSRIADFTAQMSRSAPPEVLSAVGAEIQKLAETGGAERALATGSKAPGFTLPDSSGARISLASLLAAGPVVVSFYRGGWCPFCDLQLRAYQQVLPRIRELGAQLVAISPQLPDFAASDVKQKELTFPVLSDLGNAVARSYGLVYHLSEGLQKLQTMFGNPTPKFNGDESWEQPMPGTFVLDRDGTVLLSHVDANWMKRLEPSAIVEALEKVATR
jgi:peroxiredoxin